MSPQNQSGIRKQAKNEPDIRFIVGLGRIDGDTTAGEGTARELSDGRPIVGF